MHCSVADFGAALAKQQHRAIANPTQAACSGGGLVARDKRETANSSGFSAGIGSRSIAGDATTSAARTGATTSS
jgi:hypothetical protein